MAKFYLENHSLGEDYANMSFTQEAMEAMINHSWPGNLHELQVVVQRAILLSTSYEIDRDCIEIQSAEGMNSKWIMALPIGLPMKDVETHFILETLKHHEGNRTHCAKTLGISLRTLRNKINEFKSRGIDVVDPMRRPK
jgi:DNA-binding NtrC family response regulator